MHACAKYIARFYHTTSEPTNGTADPWLAGHEVGCLADRFKISTRLTS